jgi:hypothetical protein
LKIDLNDLGRRQAHKHVLQIFEEFMRTPTGSVLHIEIGMKDKNPGESSPGFY